MTKSILVIDDEESVRNAFMLALEDFGYEIKTADCGEKGIEYFKEGDFSLIYLDLKMPGISGIETLTEIRKLDPLVPIYIVTAFHKEFLDGLNRAREKKP